MLDFKDRSPVVCREMTTQQHLMYYSEHKTRARIGLLQGHEDYAYMYEDILSSGNRSFLEIWRSPHP